MTAYAGTGALVRLALRRDRIMLPIWLAAFVVSAASSASATVGLYPDLQSRVSASETFNGSQALVALYGRIYDTESLGALAMIKLGGLGAIAVAILSIILVTRHTRAEEESGRQELVGSTVVGRQAPLTAALVVAVLTNLTLGVLTGLGLASAKLPTDGSFAFGFAWAGVGIVFAAIAAVAAQLTNGSRAANGLSFAVLGVVYLLRAVGDTAGPNGPGWATWLSPVGWGQQFRPYAGDRWGILLLMAGFSVVVVGVAYVLVSRRDFGAGLLPDRPGPASASPRLGSALALAWRLQRGSLFGWAAGFLLAGFLFGNIATNLSGFLDSESARDMFTRLGGEKAITDQYLSVTMAILGIAASAYGIAAAMRLRAEETGTRAEPVLATGVSRVRWVWSHTLVALFGVAVLLALVGGAAGLSYAARLGDPGAFGRVFAAAAVQIPAAWVVTAIVIAGFGLLPRFAALGWAAFTAFVLLGELGPVFQLSQWALDVSPYVHVPRLPGGVFDTTPVVILLALTAGLVALGLATFRRRDVPIS